MEEAKKTPDNSEETTTKTKVKNKPKKTTEDKPAKDTTRKPVAKKDAGVPGAGKGNIFSRAKKFIRSAWLELKKVNWLGRRELVTFTGVVLVSVVIVGAAIFVVDSLLSKILALIIK